MVLDRRRPRLRRVRGGVGAGRVVPGDQDDRHPELLGHQGVETALARQDAVHPHLGDRVRQVGVREHAVRPGADVVAEEDHARHRRVLDPLEHGKALMAPGEHRGARIQLLDQQVAHRRVRVVHQDLVRAARAQPGDGRVHVAGQQRAQPLPLRIAGLDVGGPGDAGGPLHVCGDEDPHDDFRPVMGITVRPGH